ncbi:MAG: hypothetical protein ACHQ50_05770 [Fimbriimonadales bacterium]
MRTENGRLAILVLVLAVIAVVVYCGQALRTPERASPPIDGSGRAQPVNLQTQMLDDLRGGMSHDDFLRKYGKPFRMRRGLDDLLRLDYEPLTVTFDKEGKPVETIVNLGR